MKATPKQNRIANAPIRTSFALPMFAQETVATPIKARKDTTHRRNILTTALMAVLCFLASALLPSVSRAQAPVFVITPRVSTVKFFVKASVADVSTGVLDIKVQAASVDTGSGMKNSKLRSKAFFDA